MTLKREFMQSPEVKRGPAVVLWAPALASGTKSFAAAAAAQCSGSWRESSVLFAPSGKAASSAASTWEVFTSVL